MNIDFTPETVGEEYALLVGRVEAAIAYMRNTTYVDKDVVFEILGVKEVVKNG